MNVGRLLCIRNEPSRFINFKEYLDHMGEYQILKNSAPPCWIYTNFTWSGQRKNFKFDRKGTYNDRKRARNLNKNRLQQHTIQNV